MSTTESCKPAGEGAERILAAAEELFAARGYNAVSINAIAERAGVCKANIFHHFKSKNELYLAVLRAACAENAAHIEQFASAPDGLAERFGQFAKGHLRQILENERITRLVQRDLLENGPQRGQELAEQVFGQKFARLVGILRAGQAKNELRPNVDPAMVAVLLIAADLFYFESRDVLKHFPDVAFAGKPERYSEMLVDVLLHGILPTTPETPE